MSFLKSNKRIILISSIIFVFIISFSICLTTYAKPDDKGDDDEDFAKDLAYVSVGLFAATGVTIIIYQSYKYSRKLLKDEGKSKELKDNIRNFYLKIRKPLNYIHYLVGFGALTVLLIHGIVLSNKDETMVIIGWITAAVYIFYIISGTIIWLKIKLFWNSKKFIRILNKIHRSMILIIGIVVIHIVHLFAN